MHAIAPRSTKRRGVSIAVLALAMIWLSPSGAQAGNDDLIDPDNHAHHIDRNSLTANGKAAVATGIYQLDRSTMNATLSGSGDVEVYDAFYGNSGFWNNLEGYADCTDRTWNFLECDVWRIRFNDTNLGTEADWRSCGCHEFGHTAGLSHRSASNDSYAPSCMRNPAGTLRALDNHDLAVIRDTVD